MSSCTSKGALKTCDYPNLLLIKSAKRPTKYTGTPDEGVNNKQSNIVVPYVAEVSEKPHFFMSQHDIQPCNNLI